MNRTLITSVCALAMALSVSFSNTAEAASQCVGLSSSACGSKSSQCTWRKASTNKNGNKIKAHCRALPGKARASSKNSTNSVAKKGASKSSITKKKEASSVKKDAKKKLKKKVKKSTKP